jgi:hypothetical protein
VKGRGHVIRDGLEARVLWANLTASELADVEERRRSPLARRRFGALLRKVRKAEDAPLKAPLKAALDAKLAPKGE